jgi:hypothetical protein
MPSLQDGEAFWAHLSTGFTRGYYHPAPPGRGACGSRRHKRDMEHPVRRNEVRANPPFDGKNRRMGHPDLRLGGGGIRVGFRRMIHAVPPGRRGILGGLSTGCASLHPWLISFGPSGAGRSKEAETRPFDDAQGRLWGDRHGGFSSVRSHPSMERIEGWGTRI